MEIKNWIVSVFFVRSCYYYYKLWEVANGYIVIFFPLKAQRGRGRDGYVWDGGKDSGKTSGMQVQALTRLVC